MTDTASLFEQATALHRAGRLDDAEQRYRHVLILTPDHAESHHRLALLAIGRGRLADAEAAARRAMALDGTCAKFPNTLAVALNLAGRRDEAIAHLRTALSLDADFIDARLNLGLMLAAVQQPDEAQRHLRHVIAVRPDDADAHNALGVLVRHGDAKAAAACFRAALASQPRHGGASQNLAQLLLDQGAVAEALEVATNAVAHQPHDLGTLIVWLKAAQSAGDLDAAEQARQAIIAGGESAVAAAEMPDMLASLAYQDLFAPLPPALLRAVTRRIGQLLGPVPRGALPPAAKGTRIRVGYMSSNFRDHPVGHVTLSLFAAHDRSRFEVFGFDLQPAADDPYARRLHASFDRFVPLHRLPPAEAAELVRRQNLHVLVDLDGYMTMRGIRIFQHRAAPVQVFWLGHAGRLGLASVDYVVADRRVLPDPGPEGEGWEACAYLPEIYHCADLHEVAADDGGRARWGLPQNALVFCGFNNPEKIDVQAFDCWMRVLTQVPGSVLWLSNPKGAACVEENFRRAAERRGADPARLIFARRVPDKAAHLARHRCADIFLDAFTLNASSTLLDALLAGLPPVVMSGSRFSGRISTSMLTALGLGDTVSPDPETFIARAVALAASPMARADLRSRIAQGLDSKPLFQTSRFARMLERAYERMVATCEAGELPSSFEVDAPGDL